MFLHLYPKGVGSLQPLPRPLAQYEDSMEAYLDLSKGIYKDLVSVQKDGAGQLQVASARPAVGHLRGLPSSATSALAVLVHR